MRTGLVKWLAGGAAMALGLAVPLAAQGYGPAPVDQNSYEMYRGDAIEVPTGSSASWAEVDGQAVAAQILAGEKVRIIAIKQGRATVSLKEDDKLVWRAEVIVR